MPSYDYRCPDCGGTFEVFQRITAAAEATCPACGSQGPRRLISGGTFHLKGGGWYATDYKDSGRGPSAPAAPAAPSSGESAASDGGCGAPACGTGVCAGAAPAADA